MGVALYALRRVLVSVLILILASFIVFTFVRATINPEARIHSKDPQAKIELRKKLHLNDHIWVQYGRWAKGAIHGDFGKSDTNNEAITTIFKRSLPKTMELFLWGLLLAAIVGVTSGVISAIKRNTFVDYSITSFSALGIALPTVFFAYVMMELFTDVLPHLFGSGNPIFFINGNVAGHFGQGANGAWSWDSIVDYFRHLTMPILALSVQLIADWSRYQRSTMVEALQGDYMRTAISKGMSRKRAYFRHGLRNATLPMVSVFALDIGLLFSGFVITETVFSIHGMGLVFVSALQEGDATLLLAWTMLTALAIILFNLLADLILPIVDPRVRTQ